MPFFPVICETFTSIQENWTRWLNCIFWLRFFQLCMKPLCNCLLEAALVSLRQLFLVAFEGTAIGYSFQSETKPCLFFRSFIRAVLIILLSWLIPSRWAFTVFSVFEARLFLNLHVLSLAQVDEFILNCKQILRLKIVF